MRNEVAEVEEVATAVVLGSTRGLQRGYSQGSTDFLSYPILTTQRAGAHSADPKKFLRIQKMISLTEF